MIDVPSCMNGLEKSTNRSLISVIVKAATAMSAFCLNARKIIGQIIVHYVFIMFSLCYGVVEVSIKVQRLHHNLAVFLLLVLTVTKYF